jgi:uncharacterized protein
MRLGSRLAALLMVGLGLVLWTGPALALSLDEAKAQGLIGERIDGFVGVVVANPSAEVDQLVERINRERRARYEEIAAQREAPFDAVARIAGERQIDRTPAGQYVAGADGRWRQK